MRWPRGRQRDAAPGCRRRAPRPPRRRRQGSRSTRPRTPPTRRTTGRVPHERRCRRREVGRGPPTVMHRFPTPDGPWPRARTRWRSCRIRPRPRRGSGEASKGRGLFRRWPWTLPRACESGAMASGPTIVIAAGGTGGHIYPGLALAEAITDMRADAQVEFVGTSKGLEGELVPAAGYPLHLYDMVQFAGQGWRKATVPIALARSSWQARQILKGVSADAAVSMGGYSGVPLIVGARFARVPALVHEPGAVPGKANQLAARFTRNLATSFPQTRFLGVEARYMGYPLRSAITAFDREALRPAGRAAYKVDDGMSMILVTGGSQG